MFQKLKSTKLKKAHRIDAPVIISPQFPLRNQELTESLRALPALKLGTRAALI